MELAHRDHGRLEWAHVAAHDGLQALHDGGTRKHGVGALVGHGSVGAPAGDVDAPPVGRRHARPGLDGDLAGHDVAPDVRAVHAVHALEHAGGNHGLGAVAALLGRLEHEADFAFKLVFHADEKLGRAEQHCDVAVVAAGVHEALVLGGEGLARLLGDGQRVEVGAQHHTTTRGTVSLVRAGRATADGGNDAGLCGPLVRDAQGLKVGTNLLGGLTFLVGNLGVRVVPATTVYDVGARLGLCFLDALRHPSLKLGIGRSLRASQPCIPCHDHSICRILFQPERSTPQQRRSHIHQLETQIKPGTGRGVELEVRAS